VAVTSTISRFSQHNPLHLIERELIPSSVIKLRRARRGVVRHGRRVLKRPAVFEVRGDTRGAERVIADAGRDAGGRRAPADHGMSEPVIEGREDREPAAVCPDRATAAPCSSLRATPRIFPAGLAEMTFGFRPLFDALPIASGFIRRTVTEGAGPSSVGTAPSQGRSPMGPVEFGRMTRRPPP
jgi:hypothetical protein